MVCGLFCVRARRSRALRGLFSDDGFALVVRGTASRSFALLANSEIKKNPIFWRRN